MDSESMICLSALLIYALEFAGSFKRKMIMLFKISTPRL